MSTDMPGNIHLSGLQAMKVLNNIIIALKGPQCLYACDVLFPLYEVSLEHHTAVVSFSNENSGCDPGGGGLDLQTS